MVCSASVRKCALSFLKIGLVAVLVFASSYCTHKGKETENVNLSPDEAYLVDAYVRITGARDLHTVSYAKSESLFVELDSTVDTTRIFSTIRALNSNPERWLLVFRSIVRAAESNLEGVPSEQRR